ncbi:VOC family protein [Nocardia sp. CDC160]|uniref:VOC family protein n=1 Tax=Nocardia sp. CDC160 TaxID=3112166 RepID=UPI002DBB7C84|nr:VOC family protein [Nocardia sp. CDC160]MEC3919207.1 VOC family protein [Nocardia sp. CDC160]
MPLHRLTSVVVGVPNVDSTAAYYRDFGLGQNEDGWFTTKDGGRQLKLVSTPTRRLIEISLGVDDSEDLDRIGHRLVRSNTRFEHHNEALVTAEPVAGFRVVVRVCDRLNQPTVPPTPYNGPGRIERPNVRAPGVLRGEPIRPRRLGHVVIGSTDEAATRRFFTDGLGFKVSDYIAGHGAFLRCTTDHHNLLVLGAPVNFMHHTSWQVDDVDEVGRGAAHMLEDHPERHVWGLGRHHAGSNFFWYLKDPAGNFAEYFSDMDSIIDDQLWSPETLEGAKGLFNWGPPPPPSFLHPEDLAALMTGAHHTS